MLFDQILPVNQMVDPINCSTAYSHQIGVSLTQIRIFKECQNSEQNIFHKMLIFNILNEICNRFKFAKNLMACKRSSVRVRYSPH